MNKLILSLIERCLFTFNFIIGVQLPEFMQQYLQRLSGHLTEANFQLKQFQNIADIQFNGNLSILIERYRRNADNSIQQTGKLVEDLATRVSAYEEHILLLQEEDYIKRLVYFISELDISMAKATLAHFQLAIPLEPYALATGLVFAISVTIMLSMLSFGAKWLFRRLYYPNHKSKPII